MPKPNSAKTPDQLTLKSRGFESHAIGRYAITCAVLIAVLRTMLGVFRTLVFAMMSLFGHTVGQAAGLW